MRRLRPGLALILVLASVALLSAAGPSWAHTGFTPRLSDATVPPSGDSSPVTSEAPTPFTLSAAPEAPGIPWPALLGALMVVALGWRRPRRALVFAVVLLLAVFAFEDGLHSVHHLVDKAQLNKCGVAVAAAHLNATAVDDGGVFDVIRPALADPTQSDQTDPIARFPSPAQGRAPPTEAA